MITVPKRTNYPSIPQETWTKVNTISGKDRKFLKLTNMDTTGVYRHIMVASGQLTSTLTSASGKILSPATSIANGGSYEEKEDFQTMADAYVYASLTSLTSIPVATLAVDEGS